MSKPKMSTQQRKAAERETRDATKRGDEQAARENGKVAAYWRDQEQQGN